MVTLFLVLSAVFYFIYVIYTATHIRHSFPHKGYSSPQSVLPDISYEELLNCEEWKNKREEILARDNYECQYCHNNKGILQVHHKYYLKYPNNKKVKPWEYPNEALITLCDKCHKWEHSKRNPKVYYTKYE